MQYDAFVTGIHHMDEYEGYIRLQVESGEILANYLAPLEFARANIRENKKLGVDLWLVHATNVERLIESEKVFCTRQTPDGGTVLGQVVNIHSRDRFLIDCGPKVDVQTDEPVGFIKEGDFVKVRGLYRVFFPGTEWSQEMVG